MKEGAPKDEKENIIDFVAYKKQRDWAERMEIENEVFRKESLAFIDRYESYVSLLDNLDLEGVTLCGEQNLEGDSLAMAFALEYPANDVEIRMKREMQFISLMKEKDLKYEYNTEASIFTVFSPLLDMTPQGISEREIVENMERWERDLEDNKDTDE